LNADFSSHSIIIFSTSSLPVLNETLSLIKEIWISQEKSLIFPKTSFHIHLLDTILPAVLNSQIAQFSIKKSTSL
jgi:hypothetical protein